VDARVQNIQAEMNMSESVRERERERERERRRGGGEAGGVGERGGGRTWIALAEQSGRRISSADSLSSGTRTQTVVLPLLLGWGGLIQPHRKKMADAVEPRHIRGLCPGGKD
jgi:hypothetical protein